MKIKEIIVCRISRPATAWLTFYLVFIFCIPCVCASSIQNQDIPQYNPPVKSGEILRREGGNIGVSRGFNRDLLRNLTRNMSRGFTRSLMRGEERSLFRSLMRGEDRSLFRSLMRSEDRSLFRAMTRAEERSLFRTLIRGENRSLFRSLMRGEDRSLFRSLFRGEEPGLFRGDSQDTPIPEIMAPLACLRTGYTADPQPGLKWYISGPWNGAIEITINEAENSEPVLQTYIDGPEAEGIYGISLADYKITLSPDIEYEWFVTIVPYPRERSADFLASAVITYVPPSDAFAKRLSQTSDNERCQIFASEGYWYDAIDHLCQQIKNNPEDHTLYRYRAELLEQVKLGKLTDYDRKQLR